MAMATDDERQMVMATNGKWQWMRDDDGDGWRTVDGDGVR